MSRPEPAQTYCAVAQEVLTELGLRDRCWVTDISARQDQYRWCLLFELSGNTFALKGNEVLADTVERESIKHKIMVGVLDYNAGFAD